MICAAGVGYRRASQHARRNADGIARREGDHRNGSRRWDYRRYARRIGAGRGDIGGLLRRFRSGHQGLRRRGWRFALGPFGDLGFRHCCERRGRRWRWVFGGSAVAAAVAMVAAFSIWDRPGPERGVDLAVREVLGAFLETAKPDGTWAGNGAP